MRAINPASGEQLDDYPEPDDQQIERKIAQAAESQRAWGRLDIAARAAPLARTAEVLRRRRDELARLMAREMGKPIAQGRGEVDKCAWVCEYYAEQAARQLAPQEVATEAERSFVAFSPLGVVLAVMPWNFPLWQVFRFAAPALMAGNGALLKHASNVPGTSLAIEALFARAGLPAGLFQSLLIGSSRLGPVIDHPRVAAVTLTGSVAAGRAVAERAGAAVKKTVLELGGSDAYLVLADADLDLAVETCVASRLINSGQSCIAAKRFVVEAPVLAEFQRRFTERMAAHRPGDPLAEDTRLGPLARTDLRDELHAQVQASLAAGARLLAGGEVPARPGAWYPPTVLADVPPGCPARTEELFGPVAAIVPAADEDEAVGIANETDFGLGAAVFTADAARGERIAAERLAAGACFVNALVRSDPRLPFGGVKQSGYGRELSAFGIREFVNIKTVYRA